MTNYRNYQISRDLAWQVLLNENVTELPVKIGILIVGIISLFFAANKKK